MVKKKGRKKFSFVQEYKSSWNYIKDSKKFIYAILGIFLLFFLIGFFIPAPEFIYGKIIEFIKEILIETEGMSQSELILFIISNNLQSTLFAIILGFFLGLFPIMSALANGYLLGFVSAASVSNSGVLSLWRILPHGVFELPAVFISLGLGLRLGAFIFQKNKFESFKNNFLNSLKVFLLIVIPLLILAGIIEGTLMVLNP